MFKIVFLVKMVLEVPQKNPNSYYSGFLFLCLDLKAVTQSKTKGWNLIKLTSCLLLWWFFQKLFSYHKVVITFQKTFFLSQACDDFYKNKKIITEKTSSYNEKIESYKPTSEVINFVKCYQNKVDYCFYFQGHFWV